MDARSEAAPRARGASDEEEAGRLTLVRYAAPVQKGEAPPARPDPFSPASQLARCSAKTAEVRVGQHWAC